MDGLGGPDQNQNSANTIIQSDGRKLIAAQNPTVRGEKIAKL